MLSVIIPVLNEAPTIGKVVEFALADPNVAEVIVIDDGSIDGSPRLAGAAGAKVFTSSMLGKGASMHDGVRLAQGDCLLFMDGDLSGLRPDLIAVLAEPVSSGRADFVKARFERSSGRVTVLTARPLLETFFPEVSWIAQPLGGLIAMSRHAAEQLSFENDYGVDVGLLIDAAMGGLRIQQVDVGSLAHESQSLERLGRMARQVTRAILQRAQLHGRLEPELLDQIWEVERQAGAEIENQHSADSRRRPLVLLGLDRVVLRGHFSYEIARRVGRGLRVSRLLSDGGLSPEQRIRGIAAALSGVAREDFEQAALDAELMPGVVETVRALRSSGRRVGVIGEAFFVGAEIVRRRIFADFALSSALWFKGGISDGRVRIPQAYRHRHGCSQHRICKMNALPHLCDQYGVKPEQILVVASPTRDHCILREVPTAVSFDPLLLDTTTQQPNPCASRMEDLLGLL